MRSTAPLDLDGTIGGMILESSTKEARHCKSGFCSHAFCTSLFRNSGPKKVHVRPRLTTHSALAFRYDILSACARCNLTYPSDKLVALSGLAELFEEKTGDQYAAGFWKPDLWGLFAWMLMGDGARISACRTHSWSWAALKLEKNQGYVFNRCYGNYTPLITVLEVRVASLITE